MFSKVLFSFLDGLRVAGELRDTGTLISQLYAVYSVLDFYVSSMHGFIFSSQQPTKQAQLSGHFYRINFVPCGRN